jgi:cell pole-organizing protein PopZ
MNMAGEPGAQYQGGLEAIAPVDGATTETSAAAASALDALAQGLAASSIGAAAARSPGRGPDAPSLGTLVAQPLPAALHDANGYPVRTLEDAVAEMLKPLLQQWLADNMPRIIEKALRVEAARGVRSNMKPPSGS